MKVAGILTHGTSLIDTDFSKLAGAAGIPVLSAERPEEVKPMLNQAIEHNGPALVDVILNRQELLIPPSINREQIGGFTLYMIKAVLNGRGDKIVDLANTNMFR